jgi:hypothetical protein
MRGVDSGIFASIRASKLPNLNAGILMDKIKNNDHILESVLFFCSPLCEEQENIGHRNVVIWKF